MINNLFIDQDGNEVAISGYLPHAWLQVKISDIASVNYRDPKLRDLPDDTQVTFVPMASVDEVQGEISRPEQRTLAETRRGYTPFSDGDVLFAKITPCMENGKAAIARNLTNGHGFGSTEFHVLKPRPGILAEWLFYYVRQIKFRNEAKANFSGTAGQLRVKKAFIEEHRIPLAPPNEQKRIVDEIEKQFTRLDAAVTNLQRVQANLNRYKSSVLKSACEGRLVPQDPADEPAEVLLERILVERRRKWEEQEWAKLIEKAQKKVAQARRKQAGQPARISDLEPEEWQELPEEEYAKYLPKNDKWKEKYKEPEPVDAAGLPELPAGWVWARLNAISEALGGYAFKSSRYSEDGFQIVKIGNVKMNRLKLDSNPSFISEVNQKIVEKYRLRENDIVITLTGNRKKQDYGYVAIVKEQQNLLLNQRVARLRYESKLNADYFLSAMQGHFYRERFFSYETGNVGQGNVGMKAITFEAIALPPINEQKRIAAEVERRLSLIDVLVMDVRRNQLMADRLRQAILKKAFCGKLVPHDPDDEPASTLLTRKIIGENSIADN